MTTFYATELGGVIKLPDVSLRTECDWLTEGAAKKGAFSDSFTLTATDMAQFYFGGTLKAVEKRFSVYGRLTSGGNSWLGYLQCASYSEGVYRCAFIERPRDIWEEPVYRLATIPPYSGYADIYATWGTPFSAQWNDPSGVTRAQCSYDEKMVKNAPLYWLRLDAIVQVINSFQGLKIPTPDWMQSVYVYCVRGKIFSENNYEGDDYDFDAVESGSQYPLMWNLPNVSLWRFLSQLALVSGYATYIDGDNISFVSYSDFKPSYSLKVGERYIEGKTAEYGMLPNVYSRVTSVNGYEFANILAEQANGTAAGVGSLMEIAVYYSQKKADYVTAEGYAEDLETDGICVAPRTSVAGVQDYKAFAQMVAEHPKKVTYNLYGDDFRIYNPQYVPQLNGTYLPVAMTSQGGVTEVEGVLLADYSVEDLAEWDYVFALDEEEASVTPVLVASLGEPVSVACGEQYPVLVTSTNEGAFASYRVEIVWINAFVEPRWLDYMLDFVPDAGATITTIEPTAEGLAFEVTAQTGTRLGLITPPLYAAIRVRLTQLATGIQEVILPPFVDTPITDYVFNFIGCSFDEPGFEDKGGAPTFKIVYESHALSGCAPLPCDVELYPRGCNVQTGYSQSYDPVTGHWTIKSKAIWPSWNSQNETPSWDYPREHRFGSYSPGVSFRLTFQGVEMQPQTDYYATSLFAGGRRSMGYATIGTLKPTPAPYAEASAGRWLVYDFARKTWEQYAESRAFQPTLSLADPLPTFGAGYSLASRGVNFRVAINVNGNSPSAKCYGLNATPGLTGATCYLAFLEDSRGASIYNSYPGDGRIAPSGTPFYLSTIASKWHARWRMRLNSTAGTLEANEDYPILQVGNYGQGEGKVVDAPNGTIRAYPILVIDLSTQYCPQGAVFEIPLTIQTNNARQ